MYKEMAAHKWTWGNLEKSLDGGCVTGGGGEPKRAVTTALGGSCKLRHVVLGSAGEE